LAHLHPDGDGDGDGDGEDGGDGPAAPQIEEGGVLIQKLTEDDRLPKDPAGKLLKEAATYLYIGMNQIQVLGTYQSFHLPMSPQILVCACVISAYT
jgi:hypothetical protein